MFWPMHFVSSSYLINFFFVFLPLYLHFLFLGILMKASIHFFRHYKLEKFKIRATLKMVVRDHSFMTLAKKNQKVWTPFPTSTTIQFWFDSKKQVHNNYGSHVYKKTDVTLKVFPYSWIFFVTKATLKFFSSCFPI